MLQRSFRHLAGALLLWVTAAQAQSAPATASADPLDAMAPVPPVVHPSALRGYRAAGEVKVGSWREANELVTRIGGWRAYGREANEPDAAPAAGAVPAAASAPAAAPARPPAPRGHHGKH